MLNLITDPWIPVLRADGKTDVIRPDQIADTEILRPNWPRPDLNLACLELLVGLVYIADPPTSAEDWTTRQPDPERLRTALAPLAGAFELLGDGPRFLQDLGEFKSTPKPPDWLFIDGASQNSIDENSDLMVHRNRYETLPLPLAAMALYTLQNYAYSGGPGHRTSIRGAGPLVTLIAPEPTNGPLRLWELIWANVPEGVAVQPEELEIELPWMRPTLTSVNGEVCVPDEAGCVLPEAFFGMPRRIRLKAETMSGELQVSGVDQASYGTNYQQWVHPLSPYKMTKNGNRAVTPEGADFSYRNWLGVVLSEEKRTRATCFHTYRERICNGKFNLLVGGWWTDLGKAKIYDFLWSQAPAFPLDPEQDGLAARLVDAAEAIGFALALGTSKAVGEGPGLTSGAAQRVQKQFYALTQGPFETQLDLISKGQGEEAGAQWLAQCRRVAIALFDAEAMHGLADLSETRRRAAVEGRRTLLAALAGFGKTGKKIFDALEMELPKRRKKETAQ